MPRVAAKIYGSARVQLPRSNLLLLPGKLRSQVSPTVGKSFGNLPSQPKDGLVVPEDPVRFTGSDIRLREDSMDVAHVALALQSDRL